MTGLSASASSTRVSERVEIRRMESLGVASVADYQAALRSVTYFNPSDAPSSAARTIQFAVSDAANVQSSPAVRRVTAEVSVDGGDELFLPGQPGDGQAVGDGQPRRVVGEDDVLVPDLRGRHHHLLDG